MGQFPVLIDRQNRASAVSTYSRLSSTGSFSPSNNFWIASASVLASTLWICRANLFSWQAVASRNVGLDFTLGKRCAEIAEGTLAQSHASK